MVLVVDDDWRVREALPELLTALCFPVVTFGSLAEYVAYERPDVPACLVLDVHLPDVSGLDFQDRSAGEDHPPIVFITGCGDIPSSVRAIKRGAVDFLTKPLSQTQLLRAVTVALDRDRTARRERAKLAALRLKLATLSPREREAMPLIVAGLLNKQAAAQLGISEVTLQIHRRRIMQKMQADSLADLVRMAVALEEVSPAYRLGQPLVTT